jgi:polyhydroxybutyrate depolymerase
MNYLKYLSIIMLLGALTLVISAQDDSTESILDTLRSGQVVSNNIARSYHVYLPSAYDENADDSSLPLVMALHGRPGTGTDMAIITQMHVVAEAHNFIIVYPDGLQQGWNYVRDIGLYEFAGTHDDSRFLQDLVETLGEQYRIDKERVYATGFSNGGFMTQRLACEARETFAAYAVVGATGFWGLPELCEGVAPAPILLMHGTHDRSVPWQGTLENVAGSDVYINASIPQTLTFWGAHNGCTDNFERRDIPAQDNATSVSHLDYDCAYAPLAFYGIMNGGHNWVGIESIRRDIAGLVNKDINAGEVIWGFFSQHTLSTSLRPNDESNEDS